MIKEHNQLHINQPINTVFDFLTNDDKLSSWVNGIVSITPVGAHQNKVGDAVIIEVNIPKEMSIKSTLTAYNPPHHFSTAHEAGGMTGTMTYRLTEVDGGTQVDYSAEHRTSGFWMWLFSPIISKVIKKERVKELQRLKMAVEQDSKLN